MAKSQPSKTASASASSTSGVSIEPSGTEALPLGESMSLSVDTPATTPTASQKTWTNVELEALRSRLGLVAGACQDFQASGGMVWVKNISQMMPSGKRYSAVKMYLVVEDLDLKIEASKDGLDFELVALKDEAK